MAHFISCQLTREFMLSVFSFVVQNFFMNQIPIYVSIVFILTTLLTVFLFYKASNRNRKFLWIIMVWLIIQSAIAITGFFIVTKTLPPRFILLIALPFASILVIFSSSKGKTFIDDFDLGKLALLHTIRIPIEIVLFWLFLNKAVPQLMTFEGRNFDLISGITSPLVYYFGFVKKKLGVKPMLAWNFICLLILLFTVSNAILSAPFTFQKFAFDQPTIAVFYFPFVWLPGIVVPLVVFSHLISIRLLLKQWRNRNVPAFLFKKLSIAIEKP
jgi:hypothetical protein